MRIKTKSSEQTQEVGKILGEEIVGSARKKPIVIALAGDLGTGKTTFVKGLAKGLGIEVNITSPTFVLINKYPSEKCQMSNVLYHIDPYRLQDIKEIVPELKEIFSEKNAVIAIEWAERIERWLPKDTIWIELKHKGANTRGIIITSFLRS